MKRTVIPFLSVILSLGLLAGCSSGEPDFKTFCSYEQQSEAITREAWQRFNTHPSVQEVTPEQRQQHSAWVEKEHDQLREQMFGSREGYFAFADQALSNGWLVPACQEKGYWQ